jgi:hypothetical protein
VLTQLAGWRDRGQQALDRHASFGDAPAQNEHTCALILGGRRALRVADLSMQRLSLLDRR